MYEMDRCILQPEEDLVAWGYDPSTEIIRDQKLLQTFSLPSKPDTLWPQNKITFINVQISSGCHRRSKH